MKILLSGILLSVVSITAFAADLPAGVYQKSSDQSIVVKANSNKVEWKAFNSVTNAPCRSTGDSQGVKYNYTESDNAIHFMGQTSQGSFDAAGKFYPQQNKIEITSATGLNLLFKEDCSKIDSKDSIGSYVSSSGKSKSKSSSSSLRR